MSSSKRIGGGEDRLAVARDAAQHRVDEPGERGARGVRPRRPHGEIDRRVIGRVEKEDLRRAGNQRPFQHAAALRHALVELLRQRLADRAEPSEGDGGDRAGERRIARIEAGVAQRQVGGEALLERARLGHRLHDRSRRRHACDHAGRRRLGRIGPAGEESALLSSQTRLASNHCRPPRAPVYTGFLRPACVTGSPDLFGASAANDEKGRQSPCDYQSLPFGRTRQRQTIELKGSWENSVRRPGSEQAASQASAPHSRPRSFLSRSQYSSRFRISRSKPRSTGW